MFEKGYTMVEKNVTLPRWA